jgi:hypothetical protein
VLQELRDKAKLHNKDRTEQIAKFEEERRRIREEEERKKMVLFRR